MTKANQFKSLSERYTRYFTLLRKEGEQWAIVFGSYDKPDVEYERDEILACPANDLRKKDLKIISTNDRQQDIEAEVNRLNGVPQEVADILKTL